MPLHTRLLTAAVLWGAAVFACGPALAQIPGGGGGVTVGGPIKGTCPNGNVIYSNNGKIGCEVVSGTGTVTSVNLSVPAASILGVSGVPITTAGTAALTTTGTSGGIPYFSSASVLSTSAALAANALVIGGGAGSAPSTATTAPGIVTWIGAPSSANLAAALTNKTGTGLAVFGTNPTLIGATLSGTLALGSQTISGNFTVSGTPIFSGISTGTIVSGGNLGLDASNNLVKATVSGGGTPGGTSGQIQYNNAGSFGGFTAGGDFTCNTATGVCTIGSSAITTTKIASAAVTLAKQATNTANTLQGFDNSGNAADVVVGSGLSLSAGTLTSTGAVGNPTATAGPTAINGSASTAMRSDGAPAIQKGTNAQFGIVEGDNATITCVLGVCSTIGGGSAGGGVDGGTNFATVTGTGAISGTPNLVYIGSGWTTGTLTLPQISALSNPNDHLVCIDDSKTFVDGTHTLTVIPNATTPDTIANASSTGAMTTSGLSMCFRPNNTTHNWTVETTTTIPNPTNGTILTGTGTTPGSAAWVTAIPNGVTATTQSAADNSTKVATTAYIDSGGFTKTIANGTAAMGTSAITSGACASVVTASATGTATTDVLTASFNGDPTGVTGYVPLAAGMLTIISYPTANTANFKVCNNTTSSITPGAITLNWRVVR